MEAELDERTALEWTLRRLEQLRLQAADSRLQTQHLDECITALRARIDREQGAPNKVLPFRPRQS